MCQLDLRCHSMVHKLFPNTQIIILVYSHAIHIRLSVTQNDFSVMAARCSNPTALYASLKDTLTGGDAT